MAENPPEIDGWSQGIRLDLFLAKNKSWKFKKIFFSQAVKIQWLKTLAGIDGWSQGIRLDLFLAKIKSWNF